MKIIFFGSDQFALPSLQTLAQSPHKILAVVTQPDRPAGRGQKLTPCPAAMAGRELKFPVWQLTTLKNKETIQRLLDLKPDLLVVVAYGNYLPAELVDAVPYKAVNVHPSLLPRYRGASPIQTAILNGDETTGVSTMTLAPEMDAGDIYLQESTPIDANETATELENRLSALGAELLLKTLDGLQQGSLRPKPQDAALVVMTRKFEKEDGRLDFTKSARALHNQIRACQPWPGAACTLKNKLFKIFATEVRTGLEGTEAGTVVESGETLVVVCGADALVLKEIQLEGKRRMSAAEFLTGTKVPVGTKLT